MSVPRFAEEPMVRRLSAGGRWIRTVGPAHMTPRLFRQSARRQKVERVGLAPLFDLSGTESLDLEPATESERIGKFHTCTHGSCFPGICVSKALPAPAQQNENPSTVDVLLRLTSGINDGS